MSLSSITACKLAPKKDRGIGQRHRTHHGACLLFTTAACSATAHTGIQRAYTEKRTRDKRQGKALRRADSSSSGEPGPMLHAGASLAQKHNATQICNVGINKSGTQNACEGLERWPTPGSAYHTYTTLCPSTLRSRRLAPHPTPLTKCTHSNVFRSSSPAFLQAREGIRHSSKVATKVTHFHIGLVQSMQWLCARRKAAVRALVERVIMRLSLTVIVGAATALAGEAVSQPHAIPWGPLK
jgi:hypothetical protein